MSEESGSRIVSFRLSAEEFKEAERIAEIASSHGSLRNESVNTLAKACLFVRINEWKQIEYEHEAQKKKEEWLKERNIPPKGFDYVSK